VEAGEFSYIKHLKSEQYT